METLIDSFLRMSNRDLWLAFSAVAIPWLVAVVNNAAWPPLAKWGAYAVVCGAASVGFVWAYDSFETDDLPRLLLLIGVVAIAVYHLFRKPIAHFEVLTDRMLSRSPADVLSPPATEIQGGATVA